MLLYDFWLFVQAFKCSSRLDYQHNECPYIVSYIYPQGRWFTEDSKNQRDRWPGSDIFYLRHLDNFKCISTFSSASIKTSQPGLSPISRLPSQHGFFWAPFIFHSTFNLLASISSSKDGCSGWHGSAFFAYQTNKQTQRLKQYRAYIKTIKSNKYSIYISNKRMNRRSVPSGNAWTLKFGTLWDKVGICMGKKYLTRGPPSNFWIVLATRISQCGLECGATCIKMTDCDSQKWHLYLFWQQKKLQLKKIQSI